MAQTMKIVRGPSLMDLQDALLFHPCLELDFFLSEYRDPIVITLNGMLRHSSSHNYVRVNQKWLLFGHIVAATIPDRPLAGKKCRINYDPQDRAGWIQEDPDFKLGGEDLIF